jgi:hypothetical protein
VHTQKPVREVLSNKLRLYVLLNLRREFHGQDRPHRGHIQSQLWVCYSHVGCSIMSTLFPL